MQFDEKRYAQSMIDEFKAKRRIAVEHNGEFNYFTRLIAEWQAYLDSLNQV